MALSGGIRRAGRSTLVHNTVALYGVQAATLILPLVYIPYLARVLRPEGWGQVVFAQSFATWIALVLEYGFFLSATRLVARVRDDPRRVAAVVAGVQGAKLLLLLALLGLGALAYGVVPAFRAHPEFLVWALVLAVAQGLSPFWYFQGIERMRGPAALDVLAKAFAAVGVFIWVRDASDGWMVLALQGGATLLVVALATGWMYRQVPGGLRLGYRETAEIFRSCTGMFVFRVSSGVYHQANPFLLGLLASPQAVGFFGGADKIVRALISLIQPISHALYPRMSHLAGSDPGAARRLFRVSLLLVGGLGAGMGVGVMVAAPWLVRLVLGPGYEAVVPVLRCLALLPPIISLGTVLGVQWALPMGHDRQFYGVVVGAGSVHVLAAVLLVPLYGAWGMAVSVVLAESFVTCGLLWLATRMEGSPLLPRRDAPVGLPAVPERVP